MKTLKTLTLMAGIFCYTFASAFTIINLPVDEIYQIHADNTLLVSGVPIEIIQSENDASNDIISKNDDTIRIDLAEYIVREPFPGSARECISKQITYPEFARDRKLEGGVGVCFTFDDDGNIVISDVCSSNQELEKYVCSKIKNLKLNNCVVDVSKDYYLRFLFKVF